jgi:predicted AAA+ superfamily ATPase
MEESDHTLFSPFSELVATALKDTSVVMVTGPRRCGKTTLARDLVTGNREFITTDDDTVCGRDHPFTLSLIRSFRVARPVSTTSP